MANLVNIMKDLISLVDLEIDVLSIVGKRIYVCKTLHITITKIVKDEQGNEFIVTAFENNDWIEIEPYGHGLSFTGSLVVAPSITFLHGSPSSTNNEYLNISNETLQKTPFIWLLEPYDEDEEDRDSVLDCSFSGRLFFMDWADESTWLNDEHNTNVIVPMENLREALKQVVEGSYSFRSTSTLRSKPRSRFGVVVSDKGSSKKIINEDLSGVEVSFNFDLFDTDICKC